MVFSVFKVSEVDEELEESKVKKSNGEKANILDRYYLENLAMRKIYHCTPSELGEQSAYRFAVDIEIYFLEQQAKYILAEKRKFESNHQSNVDKLKSRMRKKC